MPVSQSDIAAAVHDFLVEEVLEDDLQQDETLSYDDNLLMDVGVDSMGMLRLVGFIETEYDIKISPAYFTIDNFKDIHAISAFVQTLIAEAQ